MFLTSLVMWLRELKCEEVFSTFFFIWNSLLRRECWILARNAMWSTCISKFLASVFILKILDFLFEVRVTGEGGLSQSLFALTLGTSKEQAYEVTSLSRIIESVSLILEIFFPLPPLQPYTCHTDEYWCNPGVEQPLACLLEKVQPWTLLERVSQVGNLSLRLRHGNNVL